MGFNTDQLLDLDDQVATDISEPTPTSSISISSTESAVEVKKRKSEVSISHNNSIVDFSHLKEQILPPIDDEEILEFGNGTWVIENVRDLTEQKYSGPKFSAGGFEWNLLLFPRGNANNNVAIYLEPIPNKHKVAGSEEEVPVDPNWYVCAQFTIIVSNPKDNNNYIINTSHQRFNKDATDWGFANFMDVRNLYSSRKDKGPLTSDDKLNITVFVKVLKDVTGVLWHNFLEYDSKKETGFVGFKNQGATCYLNSLLQSYFFTKSFRKAVYQIPTEHDTATDSVPLALQKIFYELQRSDDAVDTLELTKSFGWDTGDAFTQHDVQELNRILMDKLEGKMKGTNVENTLNKTFVGKMKSYIKCINVDYESSRTEDFWDIQLNVKNLSNLNQAFQNYIEVELMNGENQYAAQDFGLQDAKKGVVFEEFPSVLHLQLKRFEYDFNYDTLVKINDRYEFPQSIDLSPFLDHGDKIPEPCIYDLHGVLVHAGDISTGHYYALIKPDASDNWYRFDDDKVWKVTKRQVFEENFGMNAIDPARIQKLTRAQYQTYQLRRHTSAYMLVYIKREEIGNILQEVNDSDVPNHISSQVLRELEEQARKRKELEELHLYLNINFYTTELFKRYQGFDLGEFGTSHITQTESESEDFHPFTIKALRAAKFKDLYEELNEKLGYDVSQAKLWTMSYRRNQTIRPSSRLEDFEDLTVDEVFQKFVSKKHGKCNIWVEQSDIELKVFDEDKENEDSSHILIFIKYFDVEKQTLKGLTYVNINEDLPIASILPSINKILGFHEQQQLEVFEEVNAGSIDKLNIDLTFYKCELSNGDIITIQKKQDLSDDSLVKKTGAFYPSADLFYEFLRTRIRVSVRRLSEPNDDHEYVLESADIDNSETKEPFEFWISSDASYDDLAGIIGSTVNISPGHLKIFVNYGGNRTPLRSDTIINQVVPRSVAHSIVPLFEYEILNISLKALENMKTVKLNWLASGYVRYQVFEFLVNQDGVISELIDKLQAKLNFSDEQKKTILIWTNLQSKFYQVTYPDSDVKYLEDSVDIFGAFAPEEVDILEKYYMSEDSEQSNSDSEPKLIPVIQFHKDPRRLHGIAFLFALFPGEKLPETKARLQKKLGCGNKEFAKVQICALELSSLKTTYFTQEGTSDDESLIIYDKLTAQDYLALDHLDRTTRQGGPQLAGAGGGISIR